MSKIEMQSLIEQRKALKDQVDKITETQDAAVWRVLTLIRAQTFEGDTKNRWDQGSSVTTLTGSHNWPQYFKDFEIDGKDVVAGGIYYGTHSYSEYERVRFPELWLRCSDNGVIAALQVAWSQALKDRAAEAVRREEARVEAERKQLAELQEKYGSQ